jgi:hypothetical protein
MASTRGAPPRLRALGAWRWCAVPQAARGAGSGPNGGAWNGRARGAVVVVAPARKKRYAMRGHQRLTIAAGGTRGVTPGAALR